MTDARLTKTQLIAQLTATRGALQQVEDRREDERQERQRLETELRTQQDLFRAREAVLLSDRDALTRALEIQSRRLASPAADRDVFRAGFRAPISQAPRMTDGHNDKSVG